MSSLDIKDFQKRHDLLICIDSDGTAIDAMNAKHNLCHGPALIQEWRLEEHAHAIQSLWNDINLFSASRGVNRFIALVQMLERIDGKYIRVEGLEVLRHWVETTDNLANKGLLLELANYPHPLLEKALNWSHEINRRISLLSYHDKPPFAGVRESLAYAQGKADIAVISSSNMTALVEEWTGHDLIGFVDVITSQEIGTKSECIRQMIAKGYNPLHVLMIGDAFPDWEAAKANGTYYFPILTNQEESSWNRFRLTYFPHFVEGRFALDQAAVLDEFNHNFGVKGD